MEGSQLITLTGKLSPEFSAIVIQVSKVLAATDPPEVVIWDLSGNGEPQIKASTPVLMSVLWLPLFPDWYLRFPAGCEVLPSFASTYSWGRNTDLSVTSIAEWSPVLRAPLSPQDFDMVTPWLAYCLLPYATYHMRSTWLLMPFGQSQGHHLHLDDWPTILLDPPLVLLCPGLLTLPGLHWGPYMNWSWNPWEIKTCDRQTLPSYLCQLSVLFLSHVVSTQYRDLSKSFQNEGSFTL